MPLYEYECQQCGERTEVLQRFSDPPLESCESCGGELRKLLSAPAVQFKGTGWYVTDYGGRKSGGEGKGEGEAGSSEKSEKSEKPGKSEKSEKSETSEKKAASSSSEKSSGGKSD